MSNSKGPSGTRNVVYNGKNPLLPPKSPFPSITPSYADYIPNPPIGPKNIPKPRDRNSHHQRTCSGSVLIEDQPSWLDELLNEPETPVRRGHRRSSSDSFAYIEAANAVNIDYAAQDDYKYNSLTSSVPSRGSSDFDHYKDAWNTSFYGEPNPLVRHKNRAWDPLLNPLPQKNGLLSSRDNFVLRSPASLCTTQQANGVSSTAKEKQDPIESGPCDAKGSFESKDSLYAKVSVSETDTKRSKQQFAQRSRVRKLQYIAELERNVQALQAKGSGVSAELEFLNQQSLILSMENKALKKRLDSLAQEQHIKYLEHEVLEREIGRLRSLYQQQQKPQHQQQSSSHRRSSSRDLDSQFSNLSLKHREAGPGSGPFSGPLHI
ncbi:hypothetical protein LguiA_008524 [Lonicera macranthoides]